MDDLVKQHAYKAIQDARFVLKPFPYIYVSKVLPDDFYAELLEIFHPMMTTISTQRLMSSGTIFSFRPAESRG